MFSNSSNKQLISSLSQTLTNSIDDLSLIILEII